MTLTEALLALERAGRIQSSRIGGVLLGRQRCSLPGRLHPSDVPDLTDPATVGCLLSLLREASDNPYCHVDPEDRINLDEWVVYAPSRGGVCGVLARGDTEGEAIAAALIQLARQL